MLNIEGSEEGIHCQKFEEQVDKTLYKNNLHRITTSVRQFKIERLSMTFTADGKRQRLPLIFYPFLVILK